MALQLMVWGTGSAEQSLRLASIAVANGTSVAQTVSVARIAAQQEAHARDRALSHEASALAEFQDTTGAGAIAAFGTTALSLQTCRLQSTWLVATWFSAA